MNIEVRNKQLDSLGRSEWDLVDRPKTKSKAFSIAKKESKTSIETEVVCTDDYGEIVGHYYFEKGKLKIDMSV